MRFTSSASLISDAKLDEAGWRRVWLRDCQSWLRVTFYEGDETATFYLNGTQIPEQQAIDAFDLEMRRFGWVATEKVAA